MPAYEPIASTVVSTATATVQFTSLPTSYQHLQLRVFGKRSSVAVGDLSLRFNNDSTANYAYNYLQSNTTTRATALFSGSTSLRCGYMPESTGDSFGSAIVEIYNYRSSNRKRVSSISGFNIGPTFSDTQALMALFSGEWFDTVPITSIDVTLSSFAIGSVISLYGLRSA